MYDIQKTVINMIEQNENQNIVVSVSLYEAASYRPNYVPVVNVSVSPAANRGNRVYGNSFYAVGDNPYVRGGVENASDPKYFALLYRIHKKIVSRGSQSCVLTPAEAREVFELP